MPQYLPYQGKFLEIGDATLEGARQVKVDDQYWAKTRNGWEHLESKDDLEDGRMTYTIGSESVIRVVDSESPDPREHHEHGERLPAYGGYGTSLSLLMSEAGADAPEREQVKRSEITVNDDAGKEARRDGAIQAAQQDDTGVRPTPQFHSDEGKSKEQIEDERALEEEEVEEDDATDE